MSVATLPVSLVKVYFTAGWNMPGCLPDSDGPGPLFTSLDDAREFLASELDRAADEVFEQELENARLDYSHVDEYMANYESAHEDSTSITGSAEIIRHDPDGDVTWQAMRGEFSTSELDGYVYWIARAEL